MLHKQFQKFNKKNENISKYVLEYVHNNNNWIWVEGGCREER